MTSVSEGEIERIFPDTIEEERPCPVIDGIDDPCSFDLFTSSTTGGGLEEGSSMGGEGDSVAVTVPKVDSSEPPSVTVVMETCCARIAEDAADAS